MTSKLNLDTNLLAGRINTRLRDLGETQAALADAVGVSSAAVNQWCKGQTRELKGPYLLKAAKFLKVSPTWLSAKEGPMELQSEIEQKESIVSSFEPPSEDSDYVAVPQYSIRFQGGDGSYALEEDLDATPCYYKGTWLKSKGIPLGKAKRFRVTGDSMEPTIMRGDYILVDCSKNDPETIHEGGVYALRIGNKLKVKRLRWQSGQLVMFSDNDEYYPPEPISELDSGDFELIGRVKERTGDSGL